MNDIAARWITCPGISGKEYGVYFFRKTFDVIDDSKTYPIQVSADNRYELFINGSMVSFGPSRGEIPAWNYESVDLGPFLRKGTNVIAAKVWNYGEHMPLAQQSVQTAFFLSGIAETNNRIDTNCSWRVLRSQAYEPITDASEQLGGHYIVVPPGDRIAGCNYPWGYDQVGFNDQDWFNAVELPSHLVGWNLVPREIPFMESGMIRFSGIKHSEPEPIVPDFLNGTGALTVEAHSRITLLLDLGCLTNAYPTLALSGGAGGHVQLTYNESMYIEKKVKPHRDQTEGMQLFGIRDQFFLDGGRNRVYRPLWYRTFRYIRMDIETGEEPLTVHDFFGEFTAYPFEMKASLDCGDTRVAQIWVTAWRTARLCAHETYMDCPYYEQAQYIGDTRIQGLISLFISGDDWLIRQALLQFKQSIHTEGLTMSHYPSTEKGILPIIPPFSLLWILMIHDYWMLREDDELIKSMLPDIQRVLEWFEERVDDSKWMLGELEHWNFVDWAWPYDWQKGYGGVPVGADKGEQYSAIVTLQFVYALQAAAELYGAYDSLERSVHYQSLAQKLSEGTRKLCKNTQSGLLADSPEQQEYSQHAQIMGVLTGCLENSVMKRVMIESSLRQASLYFKFYLHRALKLAGFGDSYRQSMQSWVSMLELGFTTFPECGDLETRSDCHAWSASPLYDLLNIVAGIGSGAPGFKKVLIEPTFNGFPFIRARMPHPQGELSLHLENEGERVQGWIELPLGLTGEFRWQGNFIKLSGGRQNVDVHVIVNNL
ncbi:MAG: alpha-L-rhamnosidase [Gorillibacterium sp.]|nr:alpha-L-rhamnosidase [Gorillibacterium sp.]